MVERNDEEKAVQVAADIAPSSSSSSPGAGTTAAADLERMFREHHRRLFHMAYRVTGRAQDAEDAVQTVFLRLARREGGSPLSDSPVGYLNRATVNAALDVVRARRTARSSPLEDVEPTLAGNQADRPDRSHDRSELRDEVRRALTQVSPKAAEIFVLRYFEGFGNHEIAGMLGTSRSTVNVILHRTRHRIKEDIRSYLGERS